MTIKKWWKKTWLGKIRIFLWKTALESYILVGLKMWDSLSFTFKGGSGTGPKPEHILFLRVTSLSHQVSGSAKKKKKTKPLVCDAQVVLRQLICRWCIWWQTGWPQTHCARRSPLEVAGAEHWGSIWRWGSSPWWKGPGRRHIWSTLNDIVKKIIPTWHLRKCQN